eukprot:4905274-Amphidinium_carterae.1
MEYKNISGHVSGRVNGHVSGHGKLKCYGIKFVSFFRVQYFVEWSACTRIPVTQTNGCNASPALVPTDVPMLQRSRMSVHVCMLSFRKVAVGN